MKRMQSALSFIPPDDREVWLMCAMALKSEYGDAAFDVWDDWSRTGRNYNEQAARATWRSCKGAGVTLGSLIFEAKANGWTDDERHSRPTQDQLQARQQAAQERLSKEGIEREKAQKAAANKAAWITGQTKLEQHAYLDSKGYRDALGAVWWPSEDQNLLCVPMRIGDALVGLQMIDRTGAKRFLAGQQTSGAEFLISNSGHGAFDWFVEGYATGLSLRDCLQALRLRYRIHITFSAANMVKVAAMHQSGYVVADHDASGTGERAAVQTRHPYFMPSTEGHDFNDLHMQVGTFQASQALRQWIVRNPFIANGIANGSQTDPPSH